MEQFDVIVFNRAEYLATLGWKGANTVFALGEIVPKLLFVIGFGKTTSHADDSNVLLCRRASIVVGFDTVHHFQKVHGLFFGQGPRFYLLYQVAH